MKMVLASLLIVLSVGAALAQKEKLQPAPVPNLDSGTVAPADRAGQSNTVDNASPFAGPPSGAITGNGQPSPSTIGTPDDRRSAPTPSLSR